MGRDRIAFVLLWVGMAAGSARAMPVGPPPAPLAALRSPQVRVNGGTLQGHLNGIGESINVLTDQLDVQLLTSGFSNSTLTIQFELQPAATGNTFGLYAGHSLPGTLMPLMPAVATANWFAVASWRTDDCLVFIEEITYGIVPVMRTTWGNLKSRFR